MKNETMRWLKSQLKRKVSITKGLLITFMITGGIFTYAKTNPTVEIRAKDDTVIIEKVVKNSANSTNGGEHGNSGDDSDATIVAPYRPGVVNTEDLTREDKARLGTPSDNRRGGDGLEASELPNLVPERNNTTGNVEVSMSKPTYSDSSSSVTIPVPSDNHANDNVRYTPRSARTRRATNDNQPTPTEPTYTADTTYLIRAKTYNILGGNLITVNEDAITTAENKVFKLDDSAISTALTNKADKNADNLSSEDVIKWKDKLGITNSGSSTGPTNITITNYGEQTGLELGDNSRARGIGSVSTGRNGMAIGKNAVAIGENETKETIERKLEVDRQKIQEILNTKKEIAAKEWELRLKQIREKETIDAQRRVDETLKEKEKVKVSLDSLKDILRNKEMEVNNLKNQYVTNSNAIENKLDFVLERMKEMEDTESGHNYTANLVKSKVEEGTQLNLSLDFYKELLQNYNSYLQNPRERDDRAILKTTLSNYDTTHSSNLRNINFNYNTNDIIIPTDDSAVHTNNNNITGGTSLYSFSKNSGNGHWWMSNITPYASTAYTSTASYNPSDNPTAYNRLGSYELGKYDDTSHNIHRRYLTSSDNNTYSVYTVGDKKINTYLSIDTDITTEQEFNDWNAVKDEWKARIKSYNAKLGDEVIGKLDTLTGGKSTILYNMVTDMKFELVDLDKQITYYQGKYNETKDSSWLERKQQALDTRANRIANNETKLKDKARELGYELDNTSNLNYVLGYKHWENWKNNNISEAAKKYNVLATRLKDELENALELDRYRGLKSNDNVDKLRHDSSNLTDKYNNLNPTNEDVLLAREYQRVKEEINRLTTDLKNAETRKDNLEKALTLHNLKNIGENQIAFGTDTLAVGNNSIAMGYKAITVGTDSVNIGARGQATGSSITQLGQDLVTNGNNNISIGNTNVINGENNIVFGRNNNIGVLGDVNKSNGNIVLGSGITVSKDVTNSITLGDGSTPISNTISVGSTGNERQIKNVKDATDNQDAVTYKQLKDYVAQNVGSGNATTPIVEKDSNTTLYKTVDGVTTLNLGDKYEKITPVKLVDKVEVRPNTEGILSTEEIAKIKNEIKKMNPTIDESLITVDNKGNAIVAGTVFKASENAIRYHDNTNPLVDDNTTQDKPMYKIANKSTDGVAITNVKDATNEKDAVNLKTLNSKIADKLDKNLTGLTNDDKSTLRTNLDVYSKGEVDEKEIHLRPGTYTVKDGAVTLTQVNGEGTELTSAITINGIVDTKTLETKLVGKANTSDLENYVKKDGTNINSTVKTALTSKLTDGASLETPTGTIVTDTIVKTKLDAINSNIDNKANKDLSNVEKSTIITKVGDGNLDTTNGGLVTDVIVKEKLDLKADKSTIYNKNEIDAKLMDKANSSDLANYVKLDGTNVNSDEIRKGLATNFSENSNIADPKGILVTDSKVKDYLDNNYTNNTTLTTKLGDKLDKTGTNLSDTEKTTLLTNLGLNNVATTTNLENKLNKTGDNLDKATFTTNLTKDANLDTPTGTVVTDTMVKSKLDTKLDKTGSNLSQEEKSTLLQNLGLNNIATSDNLANKADKDLSNVTKESIVTKAGDGDLDNTNGGLVKDSVVKAKLDTKINKDLSNLDDTEKSTLRDNLNVYDKTSIDTKLNDKANIDASNINVEKFITKLNENANISNPANKLVTDTNVKDYLDTNYMNKTDITAKLGEKLDKHLTGLTDTDKDTLRTNLDVYKKSDVDSTFMKKDGSNITTEEERKTLATKLSEGSNLTNPKGILVTDSLVKEGLDKKANKEDVYTKDEIDGKITGLNVEGLAKKDGSNINESKYIEKLSNGASLDNPTDKLVTDSLVKEKLDTKANKDLSNLNDDEKSTLRDNLNVYDKTTIDNKLNDKANIDGSNIDKSKFTESLIKDTNISTPTNTIVTDKLVKDYLDSNYTNNETLTSKLDTKVNKDLSNLSDTEKSTLRDNLNVYDKTSIENKLNDKANSSDLANYLKLDGSNLTNDNRAGLITKLTDGANATNPIGALVTDTLLKTTVQDTLTKGIGAIERGDITSKTLTVTGGEDKVFGKDVSVELKDNSIETKLIKDGSVTEEKLSKDVKDRLNNSVDKTNPEDIANLYFKISELNKRLAHSPAVSNNTFITTDILHNIEDPIFDKDVANKRYVDTSIAKVSEELAVTNAMAAIPQVSGNKLLSLGAGVAHIGNKQAIALGLSGQTSNQLMIYKASAGIGLSGKWGVQAGVAFNIFNDNVANDVKNIKKYGSKDDKLREEITDMISKLSSENLELMKQLAKVSKENEDIKNKINDNENIAQQVVENTKNIKDIQEDLIGVTPNKKSIELFGFEVNAITLTDKQKEALKELSKVTKTVEIIGYADSKGNDKYNLQLGLDRAREVAKELVKYGVNVNSIGSRGYNQIKDNIGSNEYKNRRVEIILK